MKKHIMPAEVPSTGEEFTCKGCGEQFDLSDQSMFDPDLCLTCDETRDNAPSELQALVDNWVETDRLGDLTKLIDFARQLDAPPGSQLHQSEDTAAKTEGTV
jgi:hypothetical protein